MNLVMWAAVMVLLATGAPSRHVVAHDLHRSPAPQEPDEKPPLTERLEYFANANCSGTPDYVVYLDVEPSRFSKTCTVLNDQSIPWSRRRSRADREFGFDSDGHAAFRESTFVTIYKFDRDSTCVDDKPPHRALAIRSMETCVALAQAFSWAPTVVTTQAQVQIIHVHNEPPMHLRQSVRVDTKVEPTKALLSFYGASSNCSDSGLSWNITIPTTIPPRPLKSSNYDCLWDGNATFRFDYHIGSNRSRSKTEATVSNAPGVDTPRSPAPHHGPLAAFHIGVALLVGAFVVVVV